MYIYIYIWCIYSIFWVQKSFWNRCHILTSSNVVKTKTNHPWNHNFHGRYKPFPVMGALWHCFTHISSNRSVNNQHNPRPPTAAVDRGERGAALARGQGISGSHDDEAKRRSHGPLGWDIMGLGLVIKRCPIGCFFVMIFGWKGDESWCKWGVSMLHEIWFGSSMGWNGLWMALAIFGGCFGLNWATSTSLVVSPGSVAVAFEIVWLCVIRFSSSFFHPRKGVRIPKWLPTVLA